MRKLIMVKHASPLVVPGIAPERWQLSERGRESCTTLGDRLRPHAPVVIVSSIEPKAVETAELVAGRLGIPHESAAGLHEHDRSNVPHLRSSEFISSMELFFRRPDELVLGRETATQAESRFAAAIDDVLKERPEGNVAVVTHGTVIALFLARHCDKPAFRLWRELGLPSFAVLEVPDYRLIELLAHPD
jgi:broad specificity phosphatase PhoE